VLRFLTRPKWILFHLLCLIGIISMVLLSLWQFDRMVERRNFNDDVRDRTSLPLIDIADVDSADLNPADVEWRSAGAKGVYLVDEQVTIANRSQNGRAGSNVVTPLRLDDGRIVLVNRGFVALTDSAPDAPAGEVRVVGTLRAGESRRTGQPADAPGDLDEFLRLDIDRLDDQIDGDLLDVVLALEQSDPAESALLEPVPLPELDSGPHLSYAIQWLIFATAVAIGWVLAVRWSLRRRDPRSTPSA
jgi:cytochrome oxidase assembly protein ShyY1